MNQIYQVGNGNIELFQGSIARYEADALVCPANADLEMLAFPGNVQYAFLAEGGPEIFQEASALGKRLRNHSMDTIIPMSAPPTTAHITGAGMLPAQFVIHSVAVGYDQKRDTLYCDSDIVGRSVKNALDLAEKKELNSIGFPALGTGLYNVHLDIAVKAMINEFIDKLESGNHIDRIGLALYSLDQYLIGSEVANQMLR